jgi:hypothetical protein
MVRLHILSNDNNILLPSLVELRNLDPTDNAHRFLAPLAST